MFNRKIFVFFFFFFKYFQILFFSRILSDPFFSTKEVINYFRLKNKPGKPVVQISSINFPSLWSVKESFSTRGKKKGEKKFSTKRIIKRWQTINLVWIVSYCSWIRHKNNNLLYFPTKINLIHSEVMMFPFIKWNQVVGRHYFKLNFFFLLLLYLQWRCKCFFREVFIVKLW